LSTRSTGKRARTGAKGGRAGRDGGSETTATVLVTGGTGFLGSHLVRQLAGAADADVRVLARGEPEWRGELDGVEVVTGSITDADAVARAVDGVSEIYHLAGLVSRAGDHVREMYEVHVEGTRRLSEAARAAGVRTMVLVSTSGTIAVSRDPDAVATEESPRPLDIVLKWPYYASKTYQESTALEHFGGDDRRLVILNPSLLFGPGDERLTSTRVILDFLERKIPVIPPGGLNFVDVRDVALACRAAMRHGAHGERYLLGAANWSFRELFERLERLTKVQGPRLPLPSALASTGVRLLSEMRRRWSGAPEVEPAELDIASHFWYFSSERARHALGFAPRDPYDTLVDTVGFVRLRFLEAGD